MDAYGHVNHARIVTLLEAARVELFHGEMLRRGLEPITNGLVVSSLAVDYLAPVVFDGSPVRVHLWVTEIRAASFLLRYDMRAGGAGARPLVRAETRMVPYDVAGAKLRRITAGDRAFLALWTADGAASA